MQMNGPTAPVGNPVWNSGNPRIFGGKTDLERITADKQQKEENQKMMARTAEWGKSWTAQDAAQKSAESNAGGVNNTADNMSMMVTLLRENNTRLQEQNNLIKKGGWLN
jgi:hypothetical protein